MIHVIGNIAISIETQLDQPLTPDANNTAATSPSLDVTGHGALQAISAARCGAHVSLISAIGTDLLGKYALDILRKEGVQTSALSKSTEQSNLAINVSALEQKTQISASDKNISLHENTIPTDHFNARSLIVIANTHTADDNLLDWLSQVKENEAKIMLCLPLGKDINQDLTPLANIIVCDESSELSVENNDAHIITTKSCGTQGARAQKGDIVACDLHQPRELRCDDVSFDIFCGFFAACIQACLPLERSLKIACNAAGLSAQSSGTYNAIPHLGYLEDIIEGPYDDVVNTAQNY